MKVFHESIKMLPNNTWAILKVMRFVKIFVLPKISSQYNLAPDVFNYEDSKFESWHLGKNSRTIYGLAIPIFPTMEIELLSIGAFQQL